jgi:rSAM/selenodomain-associated transferase 1
LGTDGAAELAEALVEHAVRRGVEAWPGSLRLLVWPDASHPCFDRIRHRYGIEVSLQAGKDLGERMFNAVNDAYRRGAAAAVMGCDVPDCPPETYRTAHAFVSQGRSVIGPSDDGGYYLIAVHPPHPGCFERIDWGSAGVFDTTLKRAAAAGVNLIVLQQLNDIDTPSDIAALRASDPGLASRLLREA